MLRRRRTKDSTPESASADAHLIDKQQGLNALIKRSDVDDPEKLIHVLLQRVVQRAADVSARCSKKKKNALVSRKNYVRERAIDAGEQGAQQFAVHPCLLPLPL